jgi:hypothetical protein
MKVGMTGNILKPIPELMRLMSGPFAQRISKFIARL